MAQGRAGHDRQCHQADPAAHSIVADYRTHTVLDAVDLSFEKGEFICLVGPNGSGKSTLLKTIARLLDPLAGFVELGFEKLSQLPSREVAKRISILPQSPSVPELLTVRELVEQGRYPHVGAAGMLRRQDVEAVDRALSEAGLHLFADRDVNTLSGGERQRAWLALSLAQDCPTMLLDEPTTYLDVGYQLQLLELVSKLNKESGLTVVMVVHDLNHATAFSDRIVVLNDHKIVADGSPFEAFSKDILAEVFGIEAEIIEHPLTGKPYIIPIASTERATERLER